ncbi:MAG: polyprenyl synthetase family protein [Planctomycetes bacterium]|nr:polyprenyl synthetase family protein [Planctomycetota bacterium]
MDLNALQSPVLNELDAVIDFLVEKVASDFPMFEDISRHALRQHGKFLRPTIFLLSARAFGRITEEHIRLAGALELLHAASLAHDDVIDSAGLRRKSATIRSRWGDTIAVLYGDFLLARAFSILTCTPIAAARELAPPLVSQVVEGEAMQYHARYNLDLSREAYIEIVRKKTAALFAAAAQIGGTAAGADETASSALLDYGFRFGVAYQILDDVLDLIGSKAKTGKTVGTDLASGRFTLPVLLLRDAMPTQEVRETILRTSESDNGGDVEKVVDLAKKSGAIEAAASAAGEHFAAARSSLEALPADFPRKHLMGLAEHYGAAAQTIMHEYPAGTSTSVAGVGDG